VLFWRQRDQWRVSARRHGDCGGRGARWCWVVFYAPFIVNERFAATYTYLTDRRIGGSPPYNNLNDVFLRTTLYSTTYYPCCC
jgi:hypothetical protein